jgi:hypothetical protein
MRRLALILAAFITPSAAAQVITATPSGVVVADGGVIRMFRGARAVWTAEGPRNATAITSDGQSAAVLDALSNEAFLVSLRDGAVRKITTAETPIAAVFMEGRLHVLARDANLLQAVGGGNTVVEPDPAFLRQAEGRLYVYSRGTGAVQEIDDGRVTRSVAMKPGASDFEIEDGRGYLVYPRDGRIRSFDTRMMAAAGEVAVGAVPVDLDFAGGGTAITAKVLAVADPSARRVWMTEDSQSMASAVARGFLRGLLGLGLFGERAGDFPSGVDRLLIRGDVRLAFDSSSRTLYRLERNAARRLADNVAPGAYAITAEGEPVWWNGTRLVR